MEDPLQLNGIRKAQRELNDAFNFRRTINVNPTEEAFITTVTTPRVGIDGLEDFSAAPLDSAASQQTTEIAAEVGGEAATVAAATPRKKIRRWLKRKPAAETVEDLGVPTTTQHAISETLEDLEMPMPTISLKETTTTTTNVYDNTDKDEEAAAIDPEFEKYVSLDDGDHNVAETAAAAAWFGDDDDDKDPFAATAAAVWKSAAAATTAPAPANVDELSRFQQQLSGNWNSQILQNKVKLSLLATVMEKLALLEDETNNNRKWLDKEFQKQQELEQDYYRKQQALSEEAAVSIQQTAYHSSSSDDDDTTSKQQTTTASTTTTAAMKKRK